MTQDDDDDDDDTTQMMMTMMMIDNITTLHRTAVKQSFWNLLSCQSVTIFTLTQIDSDKTGKSEAEQY